MQISTQITISLEKMLQSIVHSEKTTFEVSKQSVQHFMQNSILEQAKMNGNYTQN